MARAIRQRISPSPRRWCICAHSRSPKKLLVMLHADSTGSPTWFLDSCGAATSPKRRLLLTNYELGLQHVDSLAPHARVALWAACRCLTRFAPLTSAHRHRPGTLCRAGDGRRRPAGAERLPKALYPHQRRRKSRAAARSRGCGMGKALVRANHPPFTAAYSFDRSMPTSAPGMNCWKAAYM